MTLHYESTLDDVVEAAFRRFLRGKAYTTTRWRGAVFCALAFAALAFLGFNAKEAVNLPVVCFAAAAWGAGLFLLVYKSSVRRRIKTYLAGELKGEWPRPAAFEIKDGQLIGTGAAASPAFALADFTGSVENSRWLELRFGEKEACVIPLRAFASPEEKSAFLSALQP